MPAVASARSEGPGEGPARLAARFPDTAPGRRAFPAGVAEVVLSAFGPGPFRTPGASQTVAAGLMDEWAGRLSLGPLLASNLDRRGLEQLLGEEAAGRLRRGAIGNAARGIHRMEVARRLALAGADGGVPVAFLKGVGLMLAGRVEPNRRPTGDIDVLVPKDRVERFVSLLVRDGWSSSGFRDGEQHVAPLHHPRFGTVEVHFCIPCVDVSGTGRFATWDDLREAGQLEPLADLPDGAFVPSRDLFVAHILVHGLVQHWMPASYPAFRVVGDLLDLGVPPEMPGDWERPLCWTSRWLPRQDAEAAASLCRRLARGDGSLFDPEADGSTEGRLLQHWVQGVADPDYAMACKVSSLSMDVAHAQSGGFRSRLSLYARALFPNRAELEAIYGGKASGLRGLSLRVLRPFDLVLRLLRYRSAARRLTAGT